MIGHTIVQTYILLEKSKVTHQTHQEHQVYLIVVCLTWLRAKCTPSHPHTPSPQEDGGGGRGEIRSKKSWVKVKTGLSLNHHR